MQPVRIQTPNIEAEEAEWRVLGTLLHRNDWLNDIDRLTAAHFCNPWRGELFSAIVERVRSGYAANPATLETWAGVGFETLVNLFETHHPVARAHMPSLESVIVDAFQRRALVSLGSEMISTASNTQADAVIGMAEGELRRIAMDGDSSDAWRAIDDVLVRAIEDRREGFATVFSTDLADLDDALGGGMMPGDLVIVGGRPSMGKTLLGMRIARGIANRGLGDAPCGALASILEGSSEEQAFRMASAMADDGVRYNGQKRSPTYSAALRGKLDAAGWDIMQRQAARAPKRFLLDDRPRRSVSQIRAAARRQAEQWRRNGVRLGALLVDHIGLVRAENRDRAGNRQVEVAEIVADLKGVAKELGCVVLALCQLNRGTEGREDKRPTLADLRDSGAIEQDADTVIFVFREAYYLERKERNDDEDDQLGRVRNQMDAIIAKQRNGPAQTVRLYCDIQTGLIRDLDNRGGQR